MPSDELILLMSKCSVSNSASPVSEVNNINAASDMGMKGLICMLHTSILRSQRAKALRSLEFLQAGGDGGVPPRHRTPLNGPCLDVHDALLLSLFLF